jgi:YYY domain-containing protein
MPVELTLGPAAPQTAGFRSGSEGRVAEVLLPHLQDASGGGGPVTLMVSVSQDPEGAEVISSGSYQGPLSAASSSRIRVPLDPAFELEADRMYYATFELEQGGPITMRGSVIISETSWDDGLPLRIDGRDAYGGYYTGVNQELYWADNSDDDGNGVADKLERIVNSLERGDYLVISSNRQYGSIARIEVRYPLTAAYYRALFDCPAPQSIPRCGAQAQPGEIKNDIGYELVAVFETNPRLGPFEISDQLAEEAFTVYDHPKVLIFEKTAEFDPEHVRQRLAEVDLSTIVNVLPKDAGGGLLAGSEASSRDLMLPPERWEEQRQSGTWSELFPSGRLINRNQILAVIVWWSLISLIGLAMFPWVQVAMGGLSDWGYPLSRTVGLLLLSWGSWMLGSAGVDFRPLSIGGVLLAMFICSGLIAWRDRYRLRTYLRTNWRSMLRVEALALAFFAFFLLVRIGNPDLWHPGRGGEKPMDFSYLNAVLKSTEFPPYDPWYAGGYINYYYYGFVLVGVPVKLLGLNPDVAYNLILPTLYAMLALGAYSVGVNLTAGFRRGGSESPVRQPWFAGLSAAFGVNVIGNLGTARLIYDGLKRVGSVDQVAATAIGGFFQAVRGAGRVLLGGQSLPFGIGSWYWDPSRAIPPGPGEPGPITEFPYFTFLYADLHAHMINMPLTLAALSWSLSWILRAKRRVRLRWLDTGLAFFTGGLILGALRPTNSWDFPAYWGLGAAALAFGAWLRRRIPWKALLEAVIGLALVFGFAWILYSPFSRWFGQAYTSVVYWEGGRTPLGAYLTVHGIFLFLILSWMAWETWRWLAETPVTALRGLRPYARPILFGLLAAVVLTVGLAMRGYAVVWIAVPVLLWGGLLFVRPRQPVEKRVVLVMTSVAVALTFGVEGVVLQGDIGRMNTVFKFYLQVWNLFSLSAAASIYWLLRDIHRWHPRLQRGWLIVVGALMAAGCLYPLTATSAKIRDRMAKEAPHTLDGARFMQYSSYADLGQTFRLDEDYAAIQWMRENVEGTPVIAEANAPEYRWGTRYTIYTGLPGVLGWNWHQRQQRAANPAADVPGRAREINEFYLTRSREEAEAFIEKYDVEYVILGRLERIYFEEIYPCRVEDASTGVINCDFSGRPVGMRVPEVPISECRPMDPENDPNRLSCPTHALEKFEDMAAAGVLRPAFKYGETVVYEVVR